MIKKLCIVSLYPPSDIYSHKQSGTASISANLVNNIYKIQSNIQIDVIAEKVLGSKKTNTKKISPLLTVNRIWNRNDILSLFKLTLKLVTENYDRYLFQYEWSTFGSSMLYNAIFLSMLFTLKLFNKQTYVVAHGVIVDKNTVQRLVDQKIMTRLSAKLMTILGPIFYFTISLFSKKIIVFEQILKQNLIDFAHISPNKVDVIPHGVDTALGSMSRSEARKKLGIGKDIKMLGYFGFITPYKGPYELLRLFQQSEIPKKTQLYYIGGRSTHNTTKWYDDFYKHFTKSLATADDTHLTGYVSMSEMELYMSACDVLLCPHVVMISSSGPLSLAFTFGKPVLLSMEIKEYTQSNDIADNLKKSGLTKNDILFTDNPKTFAKKLNAVFINRKKFEKFSKLMQESRNWQNISKEYLKTMQI